MSVVQGLPSLHTMPTPLHLPAAHASPLVQTLPSLQGLPSTVAGYLQPDRGSQYSVVHGLLSVQTVGVPMQAPLLQMSPLVQAVPSLQGAELAA